MNLYDNSNIDCNKKIKINYMISVIILLLINSFIVINIKIIHSNKYKNNFLFSNYKRV